MGTAVADKSAAGGGARWNRDDLERRLCRVLDLAERAIDRLAETGHTDPDDPTSRLRPEKLISETAVLLYAAATAGGEAGLSQQVERLACRLAPHARSPRMLLGMCLEPASALDYAEAHLCLDAIGYPDSAVDELLRQSRASQAARGRERPPRRVLQQEWLSGFAARTIDRRRSAGASILAAPMDLLCGSRDDVYAFTHALIYHSGLGMRPAALPRARSAILAEAEAALARALDTEDYDLGGELLMAWPMTGAPWSAGAAFGFRVLAEAEDRAGVLPAPRREPRGAPAAEPGGDRFLATAYHTAYVMGLLCALMLRPGHARAAARPARSAVGTDTVTRILAHLEDGEPRPLWRTEFDRLAPAAQGGLARFALAVALHRKAARRDFAGLRDLLGMAAETGLADTPLASQAAELLHRLGLLARITNKPTED